MPHLTWKSFYRIILPSNIFLTRVKERESHRKKELSEQKWERARERTIQTPITKRTKRRSTSVPNADPSLRSKCWSKQVHRNEANADPPLRSKRRFCPTPITPSSPHHRSFTVVWSSSFRKTHGEFPFHLWPIWPPIHTSPDRRWTVTEPHLRKTHKSDPHAHRIRCAFYIYIYIYIYLFIYINIYLFK